MFRYIRLYLDFAKQNIKVMLEYRADFFIGALSTFLAQFSGIFLVWVIFNNIKTFSGWSFYEVTFVYGLLTLGRAITHIFFDNLWVVGVQYVKDGRLDIVLLRPVSSLFHIIADRIKQDGFGTLIIGLIITVKSIEKIPISLTISNILALVIFILSSGAIISGINLIFSISAFWIINSDKVMWPVFETHQFAYYPLGIYHKFIGIALSWIIPYAFASFYPANYFLHKGYENLAFLAPVVAVILWAIGLRAWNFGLKHYESTGS